MADQKNAILAVNQAFYRAFEKKDLTAMESVWSQGIGCLCIHPGRDALKGWQAVRESWQQIFKHTKYLEIDTEIITVEASADLAYVVQIENVLQISGDRRLDAKSMGTNIFEQMGGQWYLVHHHGSPLVG
ncbi:MAG: nuclear transport factor 2 family protein [Cyanobacteria bacterium P01_A01_bin.123]